MLTLQGIAIDLIDEHAKGGDSIQINRELNSNEINESDL
jgi:hypothetical protein